MAENMSNPSEDKVEPEATSEAAETAAEVSEQVAAPEPEQPVAETKPEPEAEAAPEPEPEAEAEPEPEAAPEEPEAAPEPAPAQPTKRARSRRHVSRSQRRQRPPKMRAEKPAKHGTRKPIVRLPKPETERGSHQERRGVVVSAAMDKTVVVKVDTLKAHPRYRKVVRRSKKYHAHDESNAAKVGDVVRIVETRPLSATKCWRVAEIVEVAK
jgi:small subunit ribosomal protein S17